MMRVALFSPVWFPVPPDGYGGVETIVHSLADGLADAGVDVTLFASGDSKTRATLVSAFDTAPTERLGETFWELTHAASLLERVEAFDLVHDHSGLMGLTLFGLTPTPLVHTVHGPLTGEPGALYDRICGVVPDAALVSLTLRQRQPKPHLNWVANVHNGIDVSRFPFAREPEDFLLFLGRMSPDKGAHVAIEVARRTGRPLKIAAKCREPGERAYFEREIAPHLDRGDVEYLGEVGYDAKCQLLRTAHALIAPILWEEPFGLAFVESLACGTPVVAYARGSVPELIRHGETGFVARSFDDLVRGVNEVGRLDPAELRREAEDRFSASLMVRRTLELYTELIEGRAPAQAGTVRRLRSTRPTSAAAATRRRAGTTALD